MSHYGFVRDIALRDMMDGWTCMWLENIYRFGTQLLIESELVDNSQGWVELIKYGGGDPWFWIRCQLNISVQNP